MKTFFRLFERVVLIGFLCLLISSCGGSGGDSSVDQGTIRVVNNSTHTIDLFYVAPSSSQYWDYQYAIALTPLDTINLASFPPDTYDGCAVVTVSSTNGYWACDGGFPLTSGGTYTFAVYDSDFSGTLTIKNENYYSIMSVRLKRHTDSIWSSNILNAPVMQHSSIWIQGLTAGLWDSELTLGSHITTTTTNTITSFATTSLTVPY